MLRPMLYALCMLSLIACDDTADADPEEQPDGATDLSDAGPDTLSDAAPDADAPDGAMALPCAVWFNGEAAPLDTLEVGAGSRIALQVESADGVERGIPLVPPGWSLGGHPEANWGLVAPYTPVEPDPVLRWPVRCPDGTEFMLEQPLTLRPLTWSRTFLWLEGDDGPLAREYFSMWINPTNTDELLLYGGFHYVPQQFTVGDDLWLRDLVSGRWQRTETPMLTPATGGGGLALIPGEASALYFGGLRTEAGGSQIPGALYRLDYADEPHTWTPLEPLGLPESGSYQPAFFYDTPRDRYLAVGGQRLNGTHMDVSRFFLPEMSWGSAEVAEGEAPTGRTGFFWAHDPETERLFVFSGEQGGAPNCDCDQETWALELAETPMRWVKLRLDDPPEGRRNGAYALDPVGHRLFVWGGTPDGMNASEGVFALHLGRNEERWVRVPIEGEAPPPRASGAMVFDGARSRMLMGFGNSTAGVFADLWSLGL
ncbi:MAG: hypothetical protein ACE366_23000 [Bradymonadia bacterium]